MSKYPFQFAVVLALFSSGAGFQVRCVSVYVCLFVCTPTWPYTEIYWNGKISKFSFGDRKPDLYTGISKDFLSFFIIYLPILRSPC